MTIGGEAISGSARFDVLNPADETAFASAPECTRHELDRAMDAATEAFRTWRQDEAQRRDALLAGAKAIRAACEPIARVLSQEQGKPLSDAVDEVRGAAYWLKATAKLELPVEVVRDDAKVRIEVRRRPLGVVGAITPWNYPVSLAAWKIAPALLTGNTLVLKPSPYTPLSTLLLGEVLREHFPPGVLNIVSGSDALGAWITTHPAVRKVSFTGSVATGKKVLAASAEDLKRVTLELGGNDAAIVLDDVEVEKIAEDVFWGAFDNSGQVCSAIKRLYVHESVFDALASALTERVRAAVVGPGLQEGVDLGPVNNRVQMDKVIDLLEDAKGAGARVLCGGAREGSRGYFVQPTLLTDVGDDTRLVAEEQFGPVLPMLPFSDPADAVARANATRFGLSGSVWSSDSERATELGAELECGTVWINQHLSITANAPFGGFKHSGLGREHGPWGLAAYAEPQAIHIHKR